jgi:hypothetical protein
MNVLIIKLFHAFPKAVFHSLFSVRSLFLYRGFQMRPATARTVAIIKPDAM